MCIEELALNAGQLPPALALSKSCYQRKKSGHVFFTR